MRTVKLTPAQCRLAARELLHVAKEYDACAEDAKCSPYKSDRPAVKANQRIAARVRAIRLKILGRQK